MSTCLFNILYDISVTVVSSVYNACATCGQKSNLYKIKVNDSFRWGRFLLPRRQIEYIHMVN